MEVSLQEHNNGKEIRIGIISDTHGLLRPEAQVALEGSDVILHGGDVGKEAILHQLELIAPVHAVRGNVDNDYWCGRLPNVLNLSVDDLKVHMIHDLGHLDSTVLFDKSLVIYGHSHRPEIFEKSGVVYLNPGSAGPRRFNLPVTMAILRWKKGQKKLSPKLIHLL